MISVTGTERVALCKTVKYKRSTGDSLIDLLGKEFLDVREIKGI